MRVCKWEGGAEEKGEGKKSQADSLLDTEPIVGLHLTTLTLGPQPKLSIPRSHFPVPSSSALAPKLLWFLWICLVWTFSIYGILWHVASCDQFLSCSIMVHKCRSIYQYSFPFYGQMLFHCMGIYFILCIPSSVGHVIIFSFGSLGYWYEHLSWPGCKFHFPKYRPRSEIAGSHSNLLNILRNC